MWDDISTLLSVAGPIALLIGLWVMAQISRRFGEVTHRPPHYRWLYLSMALVVLPLVMRLLALGQTPDELAARGSGRAETLLHDLPLVAALGLAAVIAWHYWNWLLFAKDATSNSTPNRRA